MDFLTLPNRHVIAVVASAVEETHHIYQEIYIEQVYALAGRDLFHSLPNTPPPLVVDVGANVGMFAMWARQQGPVRVICIEPNDLCHAPLRWNLARAFGGEAGSVEEVGGAWTDGWCVCQVGAGKVSSQQPLHVFTHIPGNSTLHLEEKLKYLRQHLNPQIPTSYTTQTISVLPLAEILSNVAGNISMLKVDVEGAEVDVLEGVGQELWGRVSGIVVEASSNSHRIAVRNILERNGFECRDDMEVDVSMEEETSGDTNRGSTRTCLVWARKLPHKRCSPD